MKSSDGLNGFNKIFNFTTLTAGMNTWAITNVISVVVAECQRVSLSLMSGYTGADSGAKNLRVNSFEDNVNTSSA